MSNHKCFNCDHPCDCEGGWLRCVGCSACCENDEAEDSADNFDDEADDA